MMQLTNVLNAWGTPNFTEALKSSIEQLDVNLLPLQQGLTQSNYTTGANRKVAVLGVTDDEGFIHAKTGIFYTGLIGSGSCEDDPTSAAETNEYCEMEFNIDKRTADTEIKLLK